MSNKIKITLDGAEGNLELTTTNKAVVLQQGQHTIYLSKEEYSKARSLIDECFELITTTKINNNGEIIRENGDQSVVTEQNLYRVVFF